MIGRQHRDFQAIGFMTEHAMPDLASAVDSDGTNSSNPVPSTGESTNHRFLGGGAHLPFVMSQHPCMPELRPTMRTTDQSCPGGSRGRPERRKCTR
jgi:hypothetical protein